MINLSHDTNHIVKFSPYSEKIDCSSNISMKSNKKVLLSAKLTCTLNQRKIDSPSSPPQYCLLTCNVVPSTAVPTTCSDSSLGLPDKRNNYKT